MHEAAIECAALVKLMTAMQLNHRVEWLYDGYAAERSLALLVSDYTLVFLCVSSRFYVVADEVRGCDRVRSARKPDGCGMSEASG